MVLKKKKKNPDISGLATKTSLNDYLKTVTFNSKVAEIENKIKDADIIAVTIKVQLLKQILLEVI